MSEAREVPWVQEVLAVAPFFRTGIGQKYFAGLPLGLLLEKWRHTEDQAEQSKSVKATQIRCALAYLAAFRRGGMTPEDLPISGDEREVTVGGIISLDRLVFTLDISLLG